MKQLLLVASVQSHICQFHRAHVQLLHELGYEVTVAAHNNLDVKPGLKLDFVDHIIEVPFERSVLNKGNIAAYKKIKEVIASGDYDVIHCNTPIASVLTRMAARKTRKQGTKVVYTAHGFQFYKGSSLKNWMLYYPIELLMSRFTDLIFTINKEDYRRAKKMHAKHVQYIPGIGVDTARFRNATPKDIRQELGLPLDAFVLLTVAELHPRKNHKTMIDAMRQLQDFPIYYVLFGNGILEEELRAMCHVYSVENRVIFAGYRRDVPEIMKCCDIGVLPSIREGLGLAGIEAMAAGLPMVTSNINGILDYMIQGKTGLMCDPLDADAFAKAILTLYRDKNLRDEMAVFNVEKAKEFDVHNSVESLRKGYNTLMTCAQQ